MIRKLKLIIAALVISTVITESAMAIGSMRCGTHLISADAGNPSDMYEVLKRCGEPTARFGDTWVYKRSSSVQHRLTFGSDGMLKRIQ
jgi:hypothetical protein